MPNPWIEFVREYAKKNNITYMCAISKAKDEYKAMKEGNKKIEKVEPKKVIEKKVIEKKTEPEVQITYGVKKSKPIKEKVIEKKPEPKPEPEKVIDKRWIEMKNNFHKLYHTTSAKNNINVENEKQGENIDNLFEIIIDELDDYYLIGFEEIYEYFGKLIDFSSQIYKWFYKKLQHNKIFYPDFINKFIYPEIIKFLKKMENEKNEKYKPLLNKNPALYVLIACILGLDQKFINGYVNGVDKWDFVKCFTYPNVIKGLRNIEPNYLKYFRKF